MEAMDRLTDYRVSGCRIATSTPPPDLAPLLVVSRQTGAVMVDIVANLPGYLPGAVIAYNQSIHAKRLLGLSKPGKPTVPTVFARQINPPEKTLWDIYPATARIIRAGNTFFLQDAAGADVAVGHIEDITIAGHRVASVQCDGSVDDLMHQIGKYAIPVGNGRYIAAPEDYSVPSNGLHQIADSVYPADGYGALTRRFVLEAQIKDCEFVPIYAPVTFGSNARIKVANLQSFKNEDNPYWAYNEPDDLRGTRICAVGLNVLRVLVDRMQTGRFVDGSGHIRRPMLAGVTIFPEQVKYLLTQLPAPQSIAHIELASFLGFSLTRRVMEEAVRQGLGFGAFGDYLLVM